MPNARYDALIIDLDGTTTASRGDALPSPAVRRAVAAAQDAGAKVSVATGRSYHEAKPILVALDLRGPGVFNGGAEILEMHSGSAIDSKTIPAASLRMLAQKLLPFGYPTMIIPASDKPAIVLPAEVTEPGVMFYLDAVAKADAPNIIAAAQPVPDIAGHETSSWTPGDVVDIHITHRLGTKQQGVERLIKFLGLDARRVMAVGDGHNDLPLLTAAGLGIAMGNATEEVKEMADHVVPPLDEDGLAVAIERYLLYD